MLTDALQSWAAGVRSGCNAITFCGHVFHRHCRNPVSCRCAMSSSLSSSAWLPFNAPARYTLDTQGLSINSSQIPTSLKVCYALHQCVLLSAMLCLLQLCAIAASNCLHHGSVAAGIASMALGPVCRCLGTVMVSCLQNNHFGGTHCAARYPCSQRLPANQFCKWSLARSTLFARLHQIQSP